MKIKTTFFFYFNKTETKKKLKKQFVNSPCRLYIHGNGSFKKKNIKSNLSKKTFLTLTYLFREREDILNKEPISYTLKINFKQKIWNCSCSIPHKLYVTEFACM